MLRVSELVARQAASCRRSAAEGPLPRWLADAHDTLRAGSAAAEPRPGARRRRPSSLATAAATLAAAVLVDPAVTGAPGHGLLVVVPVAVGDALPPLVDTMRALARAQGSAAARRPARPGAGGDRHRGRARPTGIAHPGPARRPRRRRRVVDGHGRAARRRPTSHLAPGRGSPSSAPNGSGKSTLLAVLARAPRPQPGQLHRRRHRRARPHRRRRPPARRRRRRRAARLRRVAARPTCAWRARCRRRRRRATRSSAPGLGGWLDGLPDGLDTRLGTGGRGVSGGERARLGVARALLADRPLVLLDEPTAHLDHATATAVLDDVLYATDGRSVVMVSHRPEALDRFDTVLDLGARHPAAPPPKE